MRSYQSIYLLALLSPAVNPRNGALLHSLYRKVTAREFGYTDYTKLNQYVVRPVHLFPSVADIIQSIPASAACFAKLDATHGYFQIPLDEEASRLTTFILPSGRFRYLRAPMGLSSSSDEWCRHSDRVVEKLLTISSSGLQHLLN